MKALVARTCAPGALIMALAAVVMAQPVNASPVEDVQELRKKAVLIEDKRIRLSRHCLFEPVLRQRHRCVDFDERWDAAADSRFSSTDNERLTAVWHSGDFGELPEDAWYAGARSGGWWWQDLYQYVGIGSAEFSLTWGCFTSSDNCGVAIIVDGHRCREKRPEVVMSFSGSESENYTFEGSTQCEVQTVPRSRDSVDHPVLDPASWPQKNISFYFLETTDDALQNILFSGEYQDVEVSFSGLTEHFTLDRALPASTALLAGYANDTAVSQGLE